MCDWMGAITAIGIGLGFVLGYWLRGCYPSEKDAARIDSEKTVAWIEGFRCGRDREELREQDPRP